MSQLVPWVPTPSTSTKATAGVAASDGTAAATTSGTSSTVDNTAFDSPYGKTIPLLYGDTTSLGQVIWNNADALNTTAADPFANFSFAVVFGYPDPNASFAKYRRIYANGILIYDASGNTVIGAQTDSSYELRLYYGREQDQTPDPSLVTAYGKYAPAFRGMFYAVFENYDLSKETADGKMPQIIAEIQQTGDAKLLAKINTPAPYAPAIATHVDPVQQTITYIGRQGFDVFSSVDGSYQYSIPLTPLSSGASLVSPYDNRSTSVVGNKYWAYLTTGNVGRFDLDTNTQDVDFAYGGGGGGPLLATPGVGQWDQYVFVAAITPSAISVYGVSGTTATHIRDIGTDSPGDWLDLVQGYASQYPSNLSLWNAYTDPGPTVMNSVFHLQTSTTTGGTTTGSIDQQGLTWGYSGELADFDVLYEPAILSDPSLLNLTPVDTSKFIVIYGVTRNSKKLYRFIISEMHTDGSGTDVLYCCRPTQLGFAADAHVADIYQPFARATVGATLPNVAGTPLHVNAIHNNGGVTPASGTTAEPGSVGSYANPGARVGYDPVAFPPGSTATSDPRLLLTTGNFEGLAPVSGAPGDTANRSGTDNALAVGNPARNVSMTTGTTGVVEASISIPTNPQALFADDTTCSCTIIYADNTYAQSRAPWSCLPTDNFVCMSFYSYGDPFATAGNYKSVQITQPVAYLVSTTTSGPHAGPNYESSLPLYLNTPLAPMIPSNWIGLDAPVALPAPGLYGDGHSNMRQDRSNLRYVGYAAQNHPGSILDFVVFDLYSLQFIEYTTANGFTNVDTGADVAGYTFTVDATYDANAGIIVDLTNDVIFANTGNGTGSTALTDILTSMAENVGFASNQIANSGFTNINVQGAIINATVGFTQMLQAFADVFRFQVYDAPGVITYILKPRNVSFTVDWSINEDSIVPSSATTSSDTTIATSDSRIQYDRDYAEDLPTSLTISYIDGDNQCAVGLQAVKRTQFPEKTSSSDQSATIGAPVIISADTAAYYAQFALYDTWAQALSTTFTLPPAAIGYDPSDIVGITLEDGELLPVQLVGTALQPDFSVICTAKSVLQYNTFARPGQAVNQSPVATLVRNVPSTPYIADNVLVDPADDTSDGTVPYRWTASTITYLYIAGDGFNYNLQSPAERIAAGNGVVLTKLVDPGNDRWQGIDRTTFIQFRLNGPAPHSTDDTGFFAGQNVAFIGNPGRWEMIFFRDVTALGGSLYELSWLARGRRGTDAFMGQHAAGETIFFPTPDFPLFRLPSYQAFTTVNAMAVTAGSPATSGTKQTFISGGPLTPWRPVHLAAVRSGSDISITWQRRSRLYADLVTNALGEATEAYSLSILNAAGATLRTVATTSPAFLYTAAMIAADGFTGSALGLQVSQTSAVVGDGDYAHATIGV